MKLLPKSSLSVIVAIVLLQSLPVRAELLKLKGKGTVACRIVEQGPNDTRLITSDGTGRTELLVSNADIIQRLQGSDEIGAIESNKDATQLSNWATSYYFAGFEILAKRCIRGALVSDRQIGAKPRKAAGARGKPDDFSLFWNRVVLRAKTEATADRDVAAIIASAKWAKDAGLSDEASFQLRKAWSLDPSQTETVRLANEWGISLERWIQVDLTSAIDQPLISESIQDEQTQVSAEAEKEFITIPLRYDRLIRLADGSKSSTSSLGKAAFKGKDLRGFYGLRLLEVDKDRLRVDGRGQEVVYERMTLKPPEGRERSVELRNQLGPRGSAQASGDGQKTSRNAKQPRLRSKPITESANGWIGLIVEIPRQATQLKLEWAGGGEETLDLSFIRNARAPSVDALRASTGGGANGTSGGWKDNAAIRKAVEAVKGASPSMAALAIEWLLRIRLELERRSGPEAEADLSDWSLMVDGAILESGLRGEEQVRVSAWRYFSTHSSHLTCVPTVHVMKLLRKSSLELKNEWNRILDCGMGRGDCGNWWRNPSPIQHPFWTPGTGDELSSAQVCAAKMSEAILESPDAFVCGEALDRLLSLPPSATNWQFIQSASTTAQRLALSRLGDIRERSSQRQLIQALVLSAAPEIAHDLSIAARQIEMHAGETGTELLGQWSTLGSDSQRVAFLNSLAGLSMGNSVYSNQFVDMLAAATGAEGDMREAAWRLVINQLRFRQENIGAEQYSSSYAQSRSGMRAGGPFPMLIESESHDPLVHTVVSAVQSGTGDIRLDAAAALLELGYADELERAFIADEFTDAARTSLYESLIARTGLESSDAFIAFTAGILKPKAATCSQMGLNRLRELFLDTPADQQWRLRAAIKAGADFGEMDLLGLSLTKTGANNVERLLKIAGHFTRQDIQRLLRSHEAKSRADVLARINLRGGQRVDGTYRALAVVAIAPRIIPTAEDIALGRDRKFRWSHPRRITLEMPSLVLKSDDLDDSYDVQWMDSSIGSGRVCEQALPLRSPRAYFPLLATSSVWWSQSGTSPDGSDDTSRIDENTLGPLRLQSRRILKKKAPGTMTLKLAEYLEAGLRESGIFNAAELADVVPPSFAITLRYCMFGSYAGSTVTIMPGMTPAKEGDIPQPIPNPGPIHLMNVMLVLERDEGP